MKAYIEVIKFNANDIVATSGGYVPDPDETGEY